jgi:erythronate-4-phosphate dehydrogenase
MKVVVDEKIPFLLNVLEPFVDVEYYAGNEINNKILKNADAIIIRTRTKCNASLLDNTNVKFIATATIGYDHIDIDYCNKKGIKWTNAPGCNSNSVMQYVASALLTYSKEQGIDLKDQVLGVIGVGNVGKKIVKLAEYLGMTVLLNDPPRAKKEGICGYISLKGLLRDANIITCHVPLEHSGEFPTYHLVNSEFLKMANKGTIFINSSRGEVVDTKALKESLISKLIKAAFIDVWENEPDIDRELIELAYFATPHIAGYSTDGKANATKMSVQALSIYFNLGIDDWEPEDIPSPKDTLITIGQKSGNFQKVLEEAIIPTYAIRNDDKLLRSCPENFEKLRGEYPLRREFGAYHISASNLSVEERWTLLRMGFNIK